MNSKVWFFLLFALISNLLYSQSEDTYIPYRIGLKWGYSDTLGNIIVTPKYQEVISYGHDKFIVKNKNRMGVVNMKDSLILEGDYEWINLSEELILTGKYDSNRPCNYELHSENGETILKNQSNKIQPFGNLLIIGSETGFGILSLNENKTKVEKLILDTIHTSIFPLKSDSILTFIGSSQINYSIKGDSLVKVDAKTNKSEEGEIEFIANRNNRKEDRLQKEKRKIWNCYLGEHSSSNGKKLIIIKDIYRGERKVDTLHTEYKSIKIFKRSRMRYLKKDSILYARDGIINKSWAIVENLKNKYGIVNGNGEFIIPCEYDSIRAKEIPQYFKRNRLYYQPYYECMKNEKWGIIDSDNNIKLDFQFDSIVINESNSKNVVFLHQGIIVIKNGKYGIAEIGSKMTIPCEMDLITQKPRRRILNLVKDNLSGAYMFSVYKTEYFKPMFRYEIEKITYVNKFCVARLIDENGNFLGFGDKKGVLYFKENEK